MYDNYSFFTGFISKVYGVVCLAYTGSIRSPKKYNFGVGHMRGACINKKFANLPFLSLPPTNYSPPNRKKNFILQDE